MTYYFSFYEPPNEQLQTDSYEATSLIDAWSQFMDEHPNYTSVESVTDGEGGIHPTKPPGHQTT